MLVGTIFVTSPVEDMKDKVIVSEDRYKQLTELEEFENAVLTIAVISKQLIDEVFKRHKELNVRMDTMEKIAWKKIRDGAASLDHIAFNSEHCDYKKFKQSILMVKFLILELIARCDDSNVRVWQFYNLLKSFKVVYPGVMPTIKDEQKAFASLFGQADN